VVTRTRFAEDRLESAVRLGVRQYVLLGAGMDTFAYRQPPWATGLSIFEVDQPGTQAVKRRHVTAANLSVPANLTYVAIDFEAESLADGFRRGGIQLDQPTFFAWLGVTMYLTESAINAVLRTILTFPQSSEIVFTFAQPRCLASAGDGPTLAAMAASVGEPWVTYFEPEPLRATLLSLGFSSVEFLTPADASSRYFRDRSDGLPSPQIISIVSATV